MTSRKFSTISGPLITGAPCRNLFIADSSTNWQDEVSAKVSVEWAAVLRAKARQLSRPVEGMPQLITIRLGPDDISNERQPAWASWLTFGGGGGPVSMITVMPPASRRWKPVCGMLAIGVPWVSS